MLSFYFVLGTETDIIHEQHTHSVYVSRASDLLEIPQSLNLWVYREDKIQLSTFTVLLLGFPSVPLKIDMRFYSICLEYVSLSLANKEYFLVYSRSEKKRDEKS